MASSREIHTRVKSTKNTQKVTHAMEMVSASKMRRSVERVTHIRPYAHNVRSVLLNLSRTLKSHTHPLLEVRPVRNILFVIVASNRGLCGGFNAQVFKKLKAQLEDTQNLLTQRMDGKIMVSETDPKILGIEVLAIGKKAEVMARKSGKNLIASFPKLMHLPHIEDIRPVARMIIDLYNEKKYDKVSVIYTDYVSPINQQVKIRQILPLSKEELEKQIAEMDILAKEHGLIGPEREYKIEPNPDRVLSVLLPNLIQMQLYHMILESNASKEAARMMAMRNATEAAGEIADELTLAYNKLRQMKITQEIAEISAGRAVLE